MCINSSLSLYIYTHTDIHIYNIHIYTLINVNKYPNIPAENAWFPPGQSFDPQPTGLGAVFRCSWSMLSLRSWRTQQVMGVPQLDDFMYPKTWMMN